MKTLLGMIILMCIALPVQAHGTHGVLPINNALHLLWHLTPWVVLAGTTAWLVYRGIKRTCRNP